MGRWIGVPHTHCTYYGSVWLDEMRIEDFMYKMDSLVVLYPSAEFELSLTF